MVNEKRLIFLRPKLTMCIEYEKKAQNSSSGIVSIALASNSLELFKCFFFLMQVDP